MTKPPQPEFITNLSLSPKLWLAGREILGTIQDEQLSSNFRICSFAGKLRELQATGQAQVWHMPVTGTFMCLGFEVCVCVLIRDDSLGPRGQKMGFPRQEHLEWVAISSSRDCSPT